MIPPRNFLNWCPPVEREIFMCPHWRPFMRKWLFRCNALPPHSSMLSVMTVVLPQHTKLAASSTTAPTATTSTPPGFDDCKHQVSYKAGRDLLPLS
ncbi:hypothetical protein AVEN_247091-1, partial [Araneus ventricosus]